MEITVNIIYRVATHLEIPGKVTEFQSGQGKVRENGKVRETEIYLGL